HRPALDRPEIRRRSHNNGGDRDAVRILRDADDSNGGQLQHRSNGTAGASGRECGDQGADPYSAHAPWCEYSPDELSGIPALIDSSLTPSLASRFARLALSHVT